MMRLFKDIRFLWAMRNEIIAVMAKREDWAGRPGLAWRLIWMMDPEKFEQRFQSIYGKPIDLDSLERVQRGQL
jgi:hypothetical protein